MNIRSVTLGTSLSDPLDHSDFGRIEAFQEAARARFEAAGLPVQTVRLATQPFPEILRDARAAAPFAQALEATCQAHGVDYCSIGTVDATRPDADLSYVDAIPDVIRQTEMAFASVLVAAPGSGINLAAIDRAAQAIADIARTTPEGFGNLRLAVLANCDAGTPFFPAAFHRGPQAAFSIATDAADLAVTAFEGVATLAEARVALREAVEQAAVTMTRVAATLENTFGIRFGGIDFSPAPFPETARSIGRAIEALGVDAFGSSGTLFAVAFITQVLREARFPHCGFSGVMLPVLEDTTLAQRSRDRLFTLDSLLLYSAVCGTGLDTIPLPGDTSADELAAILLDVATLAVVADKPLTARLMPIPGKAAGDVTAFDFPYFANAQILDVRGRGGRRIFSQNTFVDFPFKLPYTFGN
ncbi:MAG: DUF711 family protein [Anaerolineae bacterium]|nr:DUF711 family protein [Anaerolineae bacterium]